MDAQAETYEEVELLVHKTTHDFLKRKGISEAHYEDWQAEAALAFSLAYRSCNLQKARFSTWLWHSVWNALSDKLRREAPHHSTARLNGNSRQVQDHRRSIPWDVADWLLSLSEDARIVAKLTLSGTGTWNGKKPEDVRSTLYELLHGLGWTCDQIAESFSEIREALR